MTTRLDYLARGAAIAGTAVGAATITRKASQELRRWWLERSYR
jgi:hypothetical protein